MTPKLHPEDLPSQFHYLNACKERLKTKEKGDLESSLSHFWKADLIPFVPLAIKIRQCRETGTSRHIPLEVK